MENKSNEKKNKKIDEFKACLVESGVNTDGLDIKPYDSLWDIFMKLLRVHMLLYSFVCIPVKALFLSAFR